MGRLTSSTAERLAAGRGCFGEFVDPRGVTGGRLVHTEEVLDREWPDLWRQARRARERSPLVGARKGFQRHFIGSARFWSGWPKSQATRARDRRATAPAIRLGPAAWVPKRFVTRHSPRRGTAPANRCRTRRMSPTSTSFWTFRLAIKASRLARRRSRKARTPDDGPQLHEVGGQVGRKENFLIVTTGPQSERGGRMTWTDIRLFAGTTSHSPGREDAVPRDVCLYLKVLPRC
jgi:hypothetical protein